jgi:hypothetical protein
VISVEEEEEEEERNVSLCKGGEMKARLPENEAP